MRWLSSSLRAYLIYIVAATEIIVSSSWILTSFIWKIFNTSNDIITSRQDKAVLAQSAAWSNQERKALCLLLYAEVTFAKYVCHLLTCMRNAFYTSMMRCLSPSNNCTHYAHTLLLSFFHSLPFHSPPFSRTLSRSSSYINCLIYLHSYFWILLIPQGLVLLSGTYTSLPFQRRNVRYLAIKYDIGIRN